MTDALLDEVRALLQQRRKIEAIKRVREATRVGLKEAKDAVDELEAGSVPPLLTAAAGREDVGREEGTSPALWREVRALLAGGEMIAAIKRVREATGVGLKEAKETVEALAAGRPPPGRAEHLLPARCPGCGAAQSPLQVRWLAPDIAECPFCGTHHLCR
jgi:ribosomal protein L7/L12